MDASRYLLNNMGFAWGNNPYGQAAPDNLSERIGQRFSHETPSQAPRLSPAALERTLDRRPGDEMCIRDRPWPAARMPPASFPWTG